jgi:hypothetical protein
MRYARPSGNQPMTVKTPRHSRYAHHCLLVAAGVVLVSGVVFVSGVVTILGAFMPYFALCQSLEQEAKKPLEGVADRMPNPVPQ